MAVSLTISKVLNPPSQVSDSLAGGGSGLDFGQCVNGSYCPVISKAANTGYQALYLSHDAVIDPIVEVKTFIAQYSQAYGGAKTAALDIAALIAKGQNSGELTANNSDGLSGGLRIEHAGQNIASLGASAFSPARAQVKIYGNNGTDGIDLPSAFDLHVDSCGLNTAGVWSDASSPVTGKIGKDGDAFLGDTAWVGLRFYLEDAAADGGIMQWDWVTSFAYTA
jgi:hypothetical protein